MAVFFFVSHTLSYFAFSLTGCGAVKNMLAVVATVN